MKWFSIFCWLMKGCVLPLQTIYQNSLYQHLRIPCPQPSRTVSKQNPWRFFPGFQISAGIWSLTVVLVKTGNHQQLLLQALILSQGLAKMFPSMTSVLQISCLESNKTFKCKERKCGPLVHDVTKRWKKYKVDRQIICHGIQKYHQSCSKQPASKVFSKALLRRNCAWSTVCDRWHVETNRVKSFFPGLEGGCSLFSCSPLQCLKPAIWGLRKITTIARLDPNLQSFRRNEWWYVSFFLNEKRLQDLSKMFQQ